MLKHPYIYGMDALSYVLDSIKLKGVVYQKTGFVLPWGVEVAQDTNSQFWRVLKGTCYIKIPGERIIKMLPGDFVFVPHGSAHRIMGKPDSICVPAAQYVASLRSGKPMFRGQPGQDETELIGGHFEFTSPATHPFIKALPRVIKISNTNADINAWMRQLTMLVNDEVSGGRAGSNIIMGRIAEIIFILLIRAYVEQQHVAQGFLRALKDTRISNSLKLMYEMPGKEWTVAQLATSAGMSRSLYCREFKNLVGETPMGYLTNWRILKASEFLLAGKENISGIAAKVGYQSEAAFNRLFKLKVGETPARYRSKMLA